LIYNSLDKPIFNAIAGVHKEFGRTIGRLKCYEPDICPFAEYEDSNNIADEIDAYAKIIDSFFIFGEMPVYSNKVKYVGHLVCLQMIIDNKIQIDPSTTITQLNGRYDNQVFDLVNLVMPDYFKKRTIALGDYFGIFEHDKLVAVTGERMKIENFVEVSAVVTHPDHVGKGYAKQLIAHTVNKIFEDGKLPFLHVAESNHHAISLYEKLGFKTRTKIYLSKFERAK